MGAFVTFLATLLREALKLAGDAKGVKHVDEILKGRPKLSEAESKAFRQVAQRLGRSRR
jgi:hypothetical protein